jgi:hypothetical protein
VVIYNYAAIAIKDAPAGSQDRDRLNAILLRAFIVNLRILHLQIPEAGNQKQEDADGGVLENGDLTGSEPRIVANRRLVGDLNLGIRIDRRQDHKSGALCSLSYCTRVEGVGAGWLSRTHAAGGAVPNTTRAAPAAVPRTVPESSPWMRQAPLVHTS